MGQSQSSQSPSRARHSALSGIVVDNGDILATPVVGLPMKPGVTLPAPGACHFRWYRLPAAQHHPPPSSPSPRHTASRTTAAAAHTGGGNGPSDADADADAVIEVEMQDMHHRQHRRHDGSGTSGHGDVWGEEGWLAQLQVLSQSAVYVPTRADVGHKLMFLVTLLTEHGTMDRSFVTDLCIPMPTSPPRRMWVENESRRIVQRGRAGKWGQQQQQRQGNGDNVPVDSALTDHYHYHFYNELGENAQKRKSLYAPGDIDTKFTVLSYNLMAEGYLKELYGNASDHHGDQLLRRLFPNCPPFALTSSYRKKAMLNEIALCGADLLCLQAMNHADYDFMSLEMSKVGYSSVYALSSVLHADNETTCRRHSAEKNIPDQYGLNIMYRRSKFNKVRDWKLKLSDCFAEFNSVNQKMRGSVWSVVEEMLSLFGMTVDDFEVNGHIAVVTMLELKDYFMMTVDSAESDRSDDGKLIVVNIMLYRPGIELDMFTMKTQMIQLIQLYLVLQKIHAIQESIDAMHIPVILIGDLCNNRDSLLYEFVSKGSISGLISMLVQRYQAYQTTCLPSTSLSDDTTTSSEPTTNFRASRKELLKSDVSRSESISLHGNETTENRKEILVDNAQKLTHGYAFASSYMEVMNNEPEYRLSDVNGTVRQTTDYIWFPRDHMQVRRVSRLPLRQRGSNMSVPNVHFVSPRFSLMCELELLHDNDEMDSVPKEISYRDSENEEERED